MPENYDLITEEQLKNIISMIGPDKDVHAGQKFLLRLLKRGGKDAVGSFIDKARIALSEEGSLDLEYDFTHTEREIFKQARLNYMNRAEFWGVLGWGLPGVYYMAKGFTDYVFLPDTLAQHKPNPHNSPSKNTVENIALRVVPAAEILIGGALINAGYETALNIKLEQTSDAIKEVAFAVNELAKRLENQKSQEKS